MYAFANELLCEAAQKGDLEKMRVALKAGADIEFSFVAVGAD